jgi:DNA-binding winged helix-turn-helix (wHTH) protein/TolB-like protein/Flp pilus assembly protein TadD
VKICEESVKSDGRQIYEFEGFLLNADKRLLFRENGAVVPLMPKAFEILLHLAERAGTVVEKDELMSSVWPNTIVEENNLTQNISALRRALGEKHRENRFIATVPGRGYKFVAVVTQSEGIDTEPVAGQSNQSVEFDERMKPLAPEDKLETPARRPRPLFLIVSALVVIAIGTGFIILSGGHKASEDGEIRSLAVLPFKPLVAENRDESMELGMADTLISKLSGGEVAVRPLAAVRRFGLIDQDPVAAGRALGVEAVMDGSIQIANDRVRVSAKLIRVSDGRQLWAGQFNEKAADIFELQDSISERVAAALRTTLGTSNRKNYTGSLEAYQLYAKGKFHAARLVLPEVQKGIAYYEQAIALDPAYALAYVELANAYRAMVMTNDARPADVMPKAKAAALKAVELDETLAEAHNALAMTSFWYDFDPVNAEKHLLRAIELNSRSSQARFEYAHLLSNTGRPTEAISEIKRALELEPVSLVSNAVHGQILHFAGKDEDALRVLQATAEMQPNFWLVPLFMSRIHLKRGAWNEAIAAAEKARDLSGGNSEAIATIGFAHGMAGRTSEARAVLRELEERAKSRYVSAYSLAQVPAALGDKAKALDLLETGFENRDVLMMFLKVDAKWDSLRNERRFIELLAKINLE